MANKLSVVVHTENEPSALSRCLSALVSQRLSTRELEIIVVDPRKRLAVRQLVTWWNHCLAARASTTRVNYIAPKASGRADTFVYRLCSGDIVAQLDETAAPDPNWAARGIASVLERDSSSRTIFRQYEGFHRRHELVAAEQQVSSRVAVSSAQHVSAATMVPSVAPMRLATPLSPAEKSDRVLFPPLRSYLTALFVLTALAAAFAPDGALSFTAGTMAIIGLVSLMLLPPASGDERGAFRAFVLTARESAIAFRARFRRRVS